MHRIKIYTLALALTVLFSAAAWAAPTDEARALYAQFVAAQNARDLDKVRSLFVFSPHFLWVSDGMSVWGPDATIKRMSLFQEAEVWHVEPDLAKSVAVTINDQSAFLHLPLVLTIGPNEKPQDFAFLVTMLCIKTDEGWRIAGLFTTTAKTN